MSSCFRSDPNFCPECGSVLPRPGIPDFVCCPRCSFKIPFSAFLGVVSRTTVVFNTLEKSSVTRDETDKLTGPRIDRVCSRCDKVGMIYHTRQMRSADEGQTVFYMCIHCRYLEKEDS